MIIINLYYKGCDKRFNCYVYIFKKFFGIFWIYFFYVKIVLSFIVVFSICFVVVLYFLYMFFRDKMWEFEF